MLPVPIWSSCCQIQKSAPFFKEPPTKGRATKVHPIPIPACLLPDLWDMLASCINNPLLSQARWALACGCAALASQGHAQVVDDFDIRFQAQQNGGIRFLANTTMFCGTGSSCVSAQSATPFDGSADNNNSHEMQYYNGDNDPDTWCASSDSLALGVCAKVSWAGLYWVGRLGNGSVPNENLRDQVKIKASDNEPYLDVLADQEWEFDAGVDNYGACRRDAVGGKQPRQRPVHRRQRRGHPRLRVVGRLGVGRGVRGCVGIHAQLDGV